MTTGRMTDGRTDRCRQATHIWLLMRVSNNRSPFDNSWAQKAACKQTLNKPSHQYPLDQAMRPRLSATSTHDTNSTLRGIFSILYNYSSLGENKKKTVTSGCRREQVGARWTPSVCQTVAWLAKQRCVRSRPPAILRCWRQTNEQTNRQTEGYRHRVKTRFCGGGLKCSTVVLPEIT